MTKKSSSRLARDAETKRANDFKKKNTAWDDVRSLYTEAQNTINHMANVVTAFFSVEGVALYLPLDQRKYAADLVRGLSTDIQSFQERLNGLYAQHKDKHGMLHLDNEADSYTNMIQLWSAYVDFKRDVTLVLEPIYQQTMAIMSVAETNIRMVAEGEAQAA